VFDYAPTSRNGPIQAFFSEIVGKNPQSPVELSREGFEAVCPRLFHHVLEADGEWIAPRNA
jgi:hypothetical protein